MHNETGEDAMTKTLDDAITELMTEISAMESDVRKKKETVNTLCGVAQRPPAYVISSEESVLPTKIRPDQFYGQPLASAVRTILEMRKQQNLGAATVNEIHESLVAGGYQFQTKTEDVARASLRNSLSKNTVTFHKLPNGRFGLLSWYPNAKTPKSSASSSGTAEADLGEFEGDTEEETATATKEAAAS